MRIQLRSCYDFFFHCYLLRSVLFSTWLDTCSRKFPSRVAAPVFLESTLCTKQMSYAGLLYDRPANSGKLQYVIVTLIEEAGCMSSECKANKCVISFWSSVYCCCWTLSDPISFRIFIRKHFVIETQNFTRARYVSGIESVFSSSDKNIVYYDEFEPMSGVILSNLMWSKV